MYYYKHPIISDELYHHGIKGMKWGIRRFQNYDGSYTRKGLERYRQSEKEYNTINSFYKAAKKYHKINKNEDSKQVLTNFKEARKEAKKQMSLDYDQLKRDKLADKGKKLYNSGKTITGSADNLALSASIAGGSFVASRILKKNGNQRMGDIAMYSGLGLSAVNTIFAAKNGLQARKLRAYYSHSRPNRVYNPMDKLYGKGNWEYVGDKLRLYKD